MYRRKQNILKTFLSDHDRNRSGFALTADGVTVTSTGNAAFIKSVFTDSDKNTLKTIRMVSVAYPGILLGGGVQQIQLRREGRENRDLGAVAP
jgi:hypothetical protein